MISMSKPVPYHYLIDPVEMAALSLLLDAISRQRADIIDCETAWKPDQTNAAEPLIKSGVTVIEVPDDAWRAEIGLCLANLAAHDKVPLVVDPALEEVEFSAFSPPCPDTVREFTLPVQNTMSRFGLITPPIPRRWVGSPIAIFNLDPECHDQVDDEQFAVDRQRTIQILQRAGVSIVILCNDLARLPHRVLAKVDRRSSADGLRVNSPTFREVARHFNDNFVPQIMPKACNQIVSPFWFMQHIVELQKAQQQRPKWDLF